jgi:hypothetical protein
MNWKGFGWKWSWPNQGTIPTLAEKMGKLKIHSIAGVLTKIKTEPILTICLQCYCYVNMLGVPAWNPLFAVNELN